MDKDTSIIILEAKHIVTMHGDRWYECPHCKERIEYYGTTDLDEGIWWCRGRKYAYKCPKCGELITFQDQDNTVKEKEKPMKDNIEVILEKNKFRPKMNNITKSISDTDFYKLKHAYGAAFFHGESWYKCPYCGDSFEYFDVMYRYEFARVINSDKKAYVCKKCKNLFIL